MKILTKDIKSAIRIVLNALIIICAGTGVIIFTFKSNFASVISYFTVQSNLLCVIAAGVTLVFFIFKRNMTCGFYLFFKGMTLVSILLTFSVYNFVLKQFFDMPETFESILLHLAVPLMMLIDFIFFENKEYNKLWYPFGWTIFPIFYIGYTAVFKALGGTYSYFGSEANFPYFFMDYETYGLRTAGLWILLITICYIGFSFLLIGFGRLLVRFTKN